MKNLLKLNDVKKLTKNEQQSITGGDRADCESHGGTWVCLDGTSGPSSGGGTPGQICLCTNCPPNK